MLPCSTLFHRLFRFDYFNAIVLIRYASPDYCFVMLSAETDPGFSLPHERFRFGIIPAGSTDAVVIWYNPTSIFYLN